MAYFTAGSLAFDMHAAMDVMQTVLPLDDLYKDKLELRFAD